MRLDLKKKSDSHSGMHSDDNGPFEVFWATSEGPGWYWWTCHPGCLPDCDAMGPYDTSALAWQAAKDLDFSINHGG